MRKLFFGTAVAIGTIASASGAQAFPAAPQPQTSDAAVVQVRNGCGAGWYRDPWGVCRPNGYVYRPYVAYAPPPYPVGRCWWAATTWGVRRVCTW